MRTYYLLPIFLITFSQQAAAYLDPGTGSMVLQGLIAAFAVLGFTIKSYWYKIRAVFGKASPQSLLEENAEPREPE